MLHLATFFGFAVASRHGMLSNVDAFIHGFSERAKAYMSISGLYLAAFLWVLYCGQEKTTSPMRITRALYLRSCVSLCFMFIWDL